MSESALQRLRFSACLLSALWAALWLAQLSRTGLALRIRAGTGLMVATYSRADLGPFRVNALLARGSEDLRAEWEGSWNVPRPGFTELVLKSDGAASVRLDGVDVLKVAMDGGRSHRQPQDIPPGPHRLQVLYQPGTTGVREVFLKGLTANGRSIPVSRSDLFLAAPSWWESALHSTMFFLSLSALLAWAGFVALGVRAGLRANYAKRAPAIVLGLVVLVAAAFRFEALVVTYWGVDAPDWAEALTGEIRTLRPGGFEHAPTLRPYAGDPFSYLTIARTMGGFYEPSGREPLFPALTRLSVFLAGGRDIGINFLSAFCSTMVCFAIFALGSRLCSPWAGVLAALLWAIEWQAISLSVEGWRDDLFTLEVVGCAAAIVSLYSAPNRRSAMIMGVASGLALLTRLSAFSFLLPALLASVLLPGAASRRDRSRAVAIAAAVMLLLAGPFMIACAVGYGDPFYAVNVHAAFYRNRATMPGSGRLNVMQLFSQSHSPWGFLETGFIGLTTYPFANKWSGLGALFPPLSDLARWFALAGFPILLWRSAGALCLVVLFSSILPYAWTWNLPGGSEWRFTLPAYPFYLILAAVALKSGLWGLVGLFKAESRRAVAVSALRYGATAALLLATVSWTSRQLDWQRVREAVQSGRAALIEAGARAGSFFSSGWEAGSDPGGSAKFTTRGTEARLRIPVISGAGARVVLRLAGSNGTGSMVDAFVDQERIATFSIPQGRGEAVTLDLPARHTQGQAVVEIRFVPEGGSFSPSFAVFWVRLEPVPAP